MFKNLRIAILLYVLLFVAAGTYLSQMRSTDWNDPLWVDVYPVNADGSATAQSFIDRLQTDEFDSVEEFFESQAQAYGVEISTPIKLELAPQIDDALPIVPLAGSWLQAIGWSLRMRWFAFRLGWASDRPSPDIMLFAQFHDGDAALVLERSTALRKGMIAVANLFAGRNARGSNQVVIAHELLHVVGASDKYDLATNQPVHPVGYAQPSKNPLLPQTMAELMGGRIPVGPYEAQVPDSLRQVMIGPATALEIGWLDQDSLPTQ